MSCAITKRILGNVLKCKKAVIFSFDFQFDIRSFTSIAHYNITKTYINFLIDSRPPSSTIIPLFTAMLKNSFGFCRPVHRSNSFSAI